MFVVVGLALPLFTNRTFGNDWPAHLWLVWKQGQAIAELGHPSYFLQSASGVFEPFYAFYGGTFYAFAGGISALLGQHPTVAYVAVIIAAFAGAYGGWTWLAYQLGVRGWLAQLPGVVYVTAPYIITDSFGRGDIPEFVGTSAIPMVAACSLAVLRAKRVNWPLGALMVLSATWFTACHNITTLWGTTMLLTVGLVVLVAAGPERRAVSLRRIGLLLGLGSLGVAINAWYLFPTLAYSGRTAIAKRGGLGAFGFDSLSSIFGPLRDAPPEIFGGPRSGAGWLNYPGTFDVQTPVLALGWALAVIALGWRRIGRAWRRFATGMALITAGLLYLISTDMSGVPKPWGLIQFPYRGETYATLGVCALVLAGTIGLSRMRSRGLRVLAMGTLAVIATMNFAQAIVQQWQGPSSLPSRSYVYQPENKFPPSWYAGFDYADASMKAIGFGAFVAVPGVTSVGGNGESAVSVPVTGERDSAAIDFVSPGQKPMDTNVYGGPYMIKVGGARVIGRSPSNQLAIMPIAPMGKLDHVTLATNHPFPVVSGIAVTLLSLLTCFLLTAWACWRTLRLRGLRDRLQDLRQAARPRGPSGAGRRPS